MGLLRPNLLFRGGRCQCVCAPSSIAKRNFHGKLFDASCAMIELYPIASSLKVYEEILVSCRLEFEHGNGTGLKVSTRT